MRKTNHLLFRVLVQTKIKKNLRFRNENLPVNPLVFMDTVGI